MGLTFVGTDDIGLQPGGLAVQTLFELPREPLPSATVAFGNFDGVHMGHRAMLTELRALAEDLPGGVTVVTFWPHPLAILRPALAPPMVDSLQGRLSWLERCGVDRTLVLRFDADLGARSAEWFARDVLFGLLGAAVLVAGKDARFGQGGRGDMALLRRCAVESGAVVRSFAQIAHQGAPVSSSRIRELVAEGRLMDAAAMLGRPFCLHGRVVHGDARGGTIGFPTANLEAPGQVQPGAGVYASRLQVDGTLLDGVTNAGTRPTVAGQGWRVETHLPGWSGDLYGRDVSLRLIKRIRDERRFNSVDDLKAQIGRDCVVAMSVLAASDGDLTTNCT